MMRVDPKYATPVIALAAYAVSKRLGLRRPWAPPLAVAAIGFAATWIRPDSTTPRPDQTQPDSSGEPAELTLGPDLPDEQFETVVRDPIERARWHLFGRKDVAAFLRDTRTIAEMADVDSVIPRRGAGPREALVQHAKRLIQNATPEVALAILERGDLFKPMTDQQERDSAALEVASAATQIDWIGSLEIDSALVMARALIALGPLEGDRKQEVLEQVRRSTWETQPTERTDAPPKLAEFKMTEASYARDMAILADHADTNMYSEAVEEMKPFQTLVAAASNVGELMNAFGTPEYARYAAAHAPIFTPIKTRCKGVKRHPDMLLNGIEHYTIMPTQRLPRHEMLAKEMGADAIEATAHEILTILNLRRIDTR